MSVSVEQLEVMEILAQAKLLARRYYKLTQKPLGLTGELAEFEAARLLGMELADARQAGYDATEVRDGVEVRVQIKGRCVPDPRRPPGRMGSIDLRQPFDSVMLVLLDSDFNAYAIYEACRAKVTEALERPGSVARNERGSLGVNQFKAISTLRWAKDAVSVGVV